MIRRHIGPALIRSVPAASMGRIELAEMLHRPRLESPFVNSYILQRERTLTSAQADTLIALEKAL